MMTRSEVIKRVMDAYRHSAVEAAMPYDQFFVRFSLLYRKHWSELSIVERGHATKGNFQGCYSLALTWDDIYVDDNFEFTAASCGYMLGAAESIERKSHGYNWDSQW